MAEAWLNIPADENGYVSIYQVSQALPSSTHLPEAIEALGKAIEVDPDCYWAHAALAVIYRYQGNMQMAEFHRRKVQEILQGHKKAAP